MVLFVLRLDQPHWVAHVMWRRVNEDDTFYNGYFMEIYLQSHDTEHTEK